MAKKGKETRKRVNVSKMELDGGSKVNFCLSNALEASKFHSNFLAVTTKLSFSSASRCQPKLFLVQLCPRLSVEQRQHLSWKLFTSYRFNARLLWNFSCRTIATETFYDFLIFSENKLESFFEKSEKNCDKLVANKRGRLISHREGESVKGSLSSKMSGAWK